jgi:hypothetical protein
MFRRVIALILFAALSPTAWPGKSGAGELEWSELRRNVITEKKLLNQHIDDRLFDSVLTVWDDHHAQWRQPSLRNYVSVHARVFIVNLWAPSCRPCVREIPMMMDAIKAIRQGRDQAVQVFLVAEETTASDLQEFLSAHPQLRHYPYFADGGGRIRQSLGAGSQLPVTLLLDGDMAVRYAIVGSVEMWLADLKEQAERLLKLSHRVL